MLALDLALDLAVDLQVAINCKDDLEDITRHYELIPQGQWEELLELAEGVTWNGNRRLMDVLKDIQVIRDFNEA